MTTTMRTKEVMRYNENDDDYKDEDNCDDENDDNKDDKDTSAYMICGLKLCFAAGFGRYRFA